MKTRIPPRESLKAKCTNEPNANSAVFCSSHSRSFCYARAHAELQPDGELRQVLHEEQGEPDADRQRLPEEDRPGRLPRLQLRERHLLPGHPRKPHFLSGADARAHARQPPGVGLSRLTAPFVLSFFQTFSFPSQNTYVRRW